VLAGCKVATLDALGEFDLLLGREQGHFVDVGQICIEGLVSHGDFRRVVDGGGIDRFDAPLRAARSGLLDSRRSPAQQRRCAQTNE
jgi:hypothetical protein